MRRHVYDRLEVTGELTRVFDAGGEDALGRAVRQPDEVREGRLVWLTAVSKLRVGRTRMQVNALLTWEQVAGRSDAEIWAMFDQYTDEHIQSTRRGCAVPLTRASGDRCSGP